MKECITFFKFILSGRINLKNHQLTFVTNNDRQKDGRTNKKKKVYDTLLIKTARQRQLSEHFKIYKRIILIMNLNYSKLVLFYAKITNLYKIVFRLNFF